MVAQEEYSTSCFPYIHRSHTDRTRPLGLDLFGQGNNSPRVPKWSASVPPKQRYCYQAGEEARRRSTGIQNPAALCRPLSRWGKMDRPMCPPTRRRQKAQLSLLAIPKIPKSWYVEHSMIYRRYCIVILTLRQENLGYKPVSNLNVQKIQRPTVVLILLRSCTALSTYFTTLLQPLPRSTSSVASESPLRPVLLREATLPTGKSTWTYLCSSFDC